MHRVLAGALASASLRRRTARTTHRQRSESEIDGARAALVIDEWDEDWTRLAWVLVRGPAGIVEDQGLHAGALARLRARYPQYRAMSLEDPVAHPIVRIAPLSVTAWRASETR